MTEIAVLVWKQTSEMIKVSCLLPLSSSASRGVLALSDIPGFIKHTSGVIDHRQYSPVCPTIFLLCSSVSVSSYKGHQS